MAEDSGHSEDGISHILLLHQGEKLPMPEKLVAATAKNNGSYGYIIMELLLWYRWKTLSSTEGVVVAAARNSVYGYRTMELLFEHQ